MPDDDLTEAKKEKIIEALENDNHKWRTIIGIVKETGLDDLLVKKAISTLTDKIIQSSLPSKNGEELFTTRKHYKTKSTSWERLYGGITNKVK